MDIVPEAYCDALMIMNSAPQSLLPMSTIEMHLFSYLGSVLALFQGQAVANWGYKYAVTEEGFPFSAEFEEARQVLVSLGLVEINDDGLQAARPSELAAELDTVVSVGPWGQRLPWMKAATTCALALPLGSIRYAIARTAGMESSIKLGQRRGLLDADDVSELYEEYRIVTSILEVTDRDVLSPAVIWLSARIMQNEDAEVEL